MKLLLQSFNLGAVGFGVDLVRRPRMVLFDTEKQHPNLLPPLVCLAILDFAYRGPVTWKHRAISMCKESDVYIRILKVVKRELHRIFRTAGKVFHSNRMATERKYCFSR